MKVLERWLATFSVADLAALPSYVRLRMLKRFSESLAGWQLCVSSAGENYLVHWTHPSLFCLYYSTIHEICQWKIVQISSKRRNVQKPLPQNIQPAQNQRESFPIPEKGRHGSRRAALFRPYSTVSSPSFTSTVTVCPGSTSPAMIFRPTRVSTVCWRYRRRGRAP